MHRILIVDEQPLFARGLGKLLDEQVNLGVCGQHQDIHSVPKLLEADRPDLLILSQAQDLCATLQIVRPARTAGTGGFCF